MYPSIQILHECVSTCMHADTFVCVHAYARSLMSTLNHPHPPRWCMSMHGTGKVVANSEKEEWVTMGGKLQLRPSQAKAEPKPECKAQLGFSEAKVLSFGPSWAVHNTQTILIQQQEEQRHLQEQELQRQWDEELEQAKQDERKKNRNKFLLFTDAPMLAIPSVIPFPLALCKL
ncbi:hypothetical protein HD554DRAFT_2041154 [Boletus coccyginus]|nr:hypothetical protein HD554DRAFT_2041154 [Boletus coccyginus]